MKVKKCRRCPDLIFASEEEHANHIKNVHKKQKSESFMCTDCGKQFKVNAELKHHINSKCGTIKLYKCKVCDQELMTAGSLHNHMLRHTDEKKYMCRFCAKLFLTIGQLKVHERIHTQEKVYVCQICGKGFCHRQSLITHSTLHTGIKPFQCDNCGKSFSCIGNLIKHRKTYADTCGLVPLKSHRVSHAPTKIKVIINTPSNTKLKKQSDEYKNVSNSRYEKTHNGSVCLEEEHNFATKKIVVAQDTNEMKSSFATCDFGSVSNGNIHSQDKNGLDFRVEENLGTSHGFADAPNETGNEILQNQHNKHKSRYTTSFSTANSNFRCNENNFNHEDFNVLTNQRDCVDSDTDVVHDEEINYNNDYNSNFDSNNEKQENSELNESVTHELQKISLKTGKDFRKRKKTKKNSDEEYQSFLKNRNLENGKSASCTYCNKIYSNLKWLFKHEKEHQLKANTLQNENLMPYKCSCCQMSFISKEMCRNHQQKEHAKELTCQECDKIFANVDSLISHQKIIHKGIPRKIYLYICEKCGQQFVQKAQLNFHKANNCKSGPLYKCEKCDKQFANFHTKQTHMRVHDPEKKLLCKFCGKSFHWKGQLKIHERSHTGEKPFTCLYCPRAFAYRESLITHSSLHTGIKPYFCEACGWKFSCIGNLVKHKKTHASTCGVYYSKNQSANENSKPESE